MKLTGITGRAEVTRRDALKLLGAGLAALEAGCLAQPGDAILPYVGEPPEARPGTGVRYATTLVLDGYAQGVLADTRDGRPLKLDGNPAHPATRGGSTPILQARILDLYDPQRAHEPSIGDEPVDWHHIARELAGQRRRVWLVMPPQSSPTIASLLDKIRTRCELHVVWDAPLSRGARWRGHKLALGEIVEQQVDVARTEVIAAFDADWLAAMPMSPAWARACAERRSPTRMNRLWACEPMPTPTGSLADERLAVRARDVTAVAAAVLAALPGAPKLPAVKLDAGSLRWARALAGELAAKGGAVIVGDRQPPIVHALARWIDHLCGRGAVTYTAPAIVDPLGGESLGDLANALRAGQVDAAIAIDCNPVYSAPRKLDLGVLLAGAPWSLHAGLFSDETSRACTIRVPLAHELEAWSDARAADGTRSIAQPVIRPRFVVASPIELLGALAGDHRPALALVKEQSGLDEDAWRAALAEGVIANSAEQPRELPPRDLELPPERTNDAIEIALAPSQLHDGRFAGNAWLQELPHSITKQTWGNAAVMAPATAATLGLGDGQLVRLETDSGAIELPALTVAGCAEGSIAIELGYGRDVPAMPIANRVGGDGYALRAGEGLLLSGRATALPEHRALAITQHVMDDHGREVAPQIDRTALHADLLAHLRGDQPSLLPPTSPVGWGMTIDTSICTGCSACMVACQAENNLAIVGAEQVRRGRHMNWLRVDRHVDERGEAVNQPVPCQHCERAPCEYVCPVQATVHSPDGLNEMVYNRCVGTRFCSNNCPYKVRRFNWFAFERDDTTALQYNPDVTVRSRGVMEKCTYCVQRIRRAEIASRVESRAIAEGEVQTACMQACPTGAIQFGNLGERTTPFASTRSDDRRYELLHDLGTRPRTIYLAKVRNR
jgi:Fe-S-cluster-containing dehydrogenase component/anaerobic selenocysteine-containing dehydrogenase